MRNEISEIEFVDSIERIVTSTLNRLMAECGNLDGRLSYNESEAAALLGIERHCLRDARLRNEIAACRLGKRIVYEKVELLAFLERRRVRKASLIKNASSSSAAKKLNVKG